MSSFLQRRNRLKDTFCDTHRFRECKQFLTPYRRFIVSCESVQIHDNRTRVSESERCLRICFRRLNYVHVVIFHLQQCLFSTVTLCSMNAFFASAIRPKTLKQAKKSQQKNVLHLFLLCHYIWAVVAFVCMHKRIAVSRSVYRVQPFEMDCQLKPRNIETHRPVRDSRKTMRPCAAAAPLQRGISIRTERTEREYKASTDCFACMRQ